MKPGATIKPEASITAFDGLFSLSIAAIRPPLTATSASYPAAPVPSTTLPFLISRSYMMEVLETSRSLRRYDRLGCVVNRPHSTGKAARKHAALSLQGQPDLGRSLGHQHPTLVFHLEINGDDAVFRARVLLLPGHAAGQKGGVADEGRADVARVAMGHEAEFAAPVGQIVQHPGAHRGAVAVTAWHPNQLRISLMHVAARRAVVKPICVRGIDFRPFHVTRHLWQPSGFHGGVGQIVGFVGAPDSENICAPLAGEGLQRVRTDWPYRQLFAFLHIVEVADHVVLEGLVVVELLRLDVV